MTNVAILTCNPVRTAGSGPCLDRPPGEGAAMPIALSRAAGRSAWWATSRRRLCSAGLAAMRCS